MNRKPGITLSVILANLPASVDSRAAEVVEKFLSGLHHSLLTEDESQWLHQRLHWRRQKEAKI